MNCCRSSQGEGKWAKLGWACLCLSHLSKGQMRVWKNEVVCAFQKLSEIAGRCLQLQGAEMKRSWCSEGPAAPLRLWGSMSLQNLWELYSVSCRHRESKYTLDNAALLPWSSWTDSSRLPESGCFFSSGAPEASMLFIPVLSLLPQRDSGHGYPG